jgi:hypothetical protein
MTGSVRVRMKMAGTESTAKTMPTMDLWRKPCSDGKSVWKTRRTVLSDRRATNSTVWLRERGIMGASSSPSSFCSAICGTLLTGVTAPPAWAVPLVVAVAAVVGGDELATMVVTSWGGMSRVSWCLFRGDAARGMCSTSGSLDGCGGELETGERSGSSTVDWREGLPLHAG